MSGFELRASDNAVAEVPSIVMARRPQRNSRALLVNDREHKESH